MTDPEAWQIVGVDFSITSTGVALPRGGTDLWRPHKTCRGVELMRWYGHRAVDLYSYHLARGPALVVIEDYAYGVAWDLTAVAEIKGHFRWALNRLGADVIDISPSAIKKFATGKGTANKDQMLAAAIRQLDYQGSSNDEADALWCREFAAYAQGEPMVSITALRDDVSEGRTVKKTKKRPARRVSYPYPWLTQT